MSSIFEWIVEIAGWFKIMLSPFLIGVGIGAVIYSIKQGIPGLIAGIVIALTGLIVGVVWATRVWKKQGTNQFLSRISASPDFDPEKKEVE